MNVEIVPARTILILICKSPWTKIMIHKKWHNSHCKFADGFAFPLVDWATLSRLLRFVVALRFLQKPHIKTVLVWEANFQSGYGSSFPNTVRFATCSINMIYDIMICSFFCAFKIFNKFGNAHFWKTILFECTGSTWNFCLSFEFSFVLLRHSLCETCTLPYRFWPDLVWKHISSNTQLFLVFKGFW